METKGEWLLFRMVDGSDLWDLVGILFRMSTFSFGKGFIEDRKR